MRGDAASAYDSIAALTSIGPIEVDFPLADGTLTKRKLTAGMLEADAFYALYGPDDRATFLRALAAGSRGDLLPLLRLAYYNLEIDPQTLVGSPDPTWYGAAYYAVTCSDYGEGTADGDETAKQVIEKAKAFAPRAPRLLNSYYVERLACAYWPKRGPNERPKPYAGGEFPTLILNADTDPITPITMSQAVMDNAQNAYLVTMAGGPHVIWGRELPCPDEIVFKLMFDGTEPEAREQICRQDFIGNYRKLTLTDPAAVDPALIGRGVELEIRELPEIDNWDGAIRSRWVQRRRQDRRGRGRRRNGIHFHEMRDVAECRFGRHGHRYRRRRQQSRPHAADSPSAAPIRDSSPSGTTTKPMR